VRADAAIASARSFSSHGSHGRAFGHVHDPPCLAEPTDRVAQSASCTIVAGNVLLDARVTGLSKDSVAVPLGLELVDRSLLLERTGRLPRALLEALDDGLRAVLGL